MSAAEDLTLLGRIVHDDGRRTIEETCEAFERTAREMGEDATLSVRQLRRWMTGKVDRPRPAARRVAEKLWGHPFDDLLGPSEVPSLALAKDAPGRLPSEAAPRRRGELEAGDPTDRRHAVQTLGGLLAGAVTAGPLVAPAAADGRRRRSREASAVQVDEVVAHLREQWHALVRTDNLLGPRFAIPGVLSQITVIEELCTLLRGEDRLDLVRLGAQYAESAAWLYEDAGNLPQARFWASRAMELAHEGNDPRMLAWTIFRRSQQAAAVGEVAHAIGLAQAARRDEDMLATPTRAAIRVQEAYGHALDGDDLAAQVLIDEAHGFAASDTAGDAHEGHGSYCTSSFIEIQRATCWLVTGKADRAITLYEEALGALPVVYQRSRAAALSRLAAAYVTAGQVDQAAVTAHRALPVARAGGSVRIVDELRAVAHDLVPHRRVGAVADLLDDLEE